MSSAKAKISRSDHCLRCPLEESLDTTEYINGEQINARMRVRFRGMNLNLCILHMFKDKFPLDEAYMGIICCDIIICSTIFDTFNPCPAEDATPISNFQLIRSLDPDCCYKFTYLMANSVDPDLFASSLDLHCLQMQGSWSS